MDADAPHDLEYVFERLVGLEEHVARDWTPMWTGSDVDLWHKSASGVTLVRARHEIDIPYSEMSELLQPEMVFHHSRPQYDPWVVGCGITEVVAPGDVIAWLHLAMSPVAMRAASFLAVVFGTVGNVCESGNSAPETFVSHMRVTLRRDFPEAGQCSWALAPLHPDTGELLEELGVQKSTGCTFVPSASGEKTVVTMLRKMPEVPMWSLPMVAPIYGHYTQEFWWRWSAILHHEDFHDVIETFRRDCGYVVVSIRKCSRGVALLPETRGSPELVEQCAEWSPWPGAKLHFPSYLKDFLACIGEESVQVFSSVDGRPLVSYQAALRRSDWERLEPIVMNPFRAQRTAYRRLHGGTHAPDLSVREPKFQEQPGRASGSSSLPMKIQVRSTFVHFGVGHALLEATRPRASDDLCALRHGVTGSMVEDVKRRAKDGAPGLSASPKFL